MTKFLIDALRPLLVPLIELVKAIYNILFGWLDRRLARRNQSALEQDVKDALPFLFSEGRGAIVLIDPTRPRPIFDYATVKVLCGNIVFCFTRGRGDLCIDVASRLSPAEWHSLQSVLRLTGDVSAPAHFQDVWQAASLLEPKITRLQQALSAPEFRKFAQDFGDDADKADRAIRRQFEFELNARLKKD